MRHKNKITVNKSSGGFLLFGPSSRRIMKLLKSVIDKYGCGCDRIEGKKLCPKHGRN